MATYILTAPNGREIEIESATPPTDELAQEVFKAAGIAFEKPQAEAKNEDPYYLDALNNAIRKIGGAVEAWDRGKYLGFGKKVGGAANAVLSYPLDRGIELATGKEMPSFSDRYNEIVQGANNMYNEFSEEHPLISFGTEAVGLLKGAPAQIEKYLAGKTATATANASNKVKTLGKIGSNIGSGSISAVGLGLGNSNDMTDYLNSRQAYIDALYGGGANAALGAAGLAGKFALSKTPTVAGLVTGTGEEVLKRAYDAGKRKSKVFIDNIRGKISPQQVKAEAKEALADMVMGNSDLYKANMAEAFADHRPLNTERIFNKYNQLKNEMTKGGAKPLYGEQKKFFQQVEERLKPYSRNNGLNDAEGLDLLKRDIQDIDVKSNNLRRIQGGISNTIKDTISEQHPKYKEGLKIFSKNKGEIDEIAKTFSLDDRSALDTTMRKLQSWGRNNVQTNYGARNKMLETLDFNGNLRDAIAGQSLNAWMPRGVVARGIAGVNAYLHNVPALVSQSPRVVGETAYKLGELARILEKVKKPSGNIGSLTNRRKE